MVESERGCGWRKMGGVYLVCDGFSLPCDALPLELKPCDCCEFTVRQARSMQPIHAGYLASLLKGHKCAEDWRCPLCFFGEDYQAIKVLTPKERERQGVKLPEVFYLMSVSKDFYSPEGFRAEAETQGVSKRVAANSLPKGFRVGEDWVFLQHGAVPFYPRDENTGQVLLDGEPRYTTGIFFAFKPQRLEVLMWKGTPDDVIADYEDAGYSVVLIEKTKENLERHGDGAPPPLPYGFKRKKKGSRDRGVCEE